jgi:hypothetical protein
MKTCNIEGWHKCPDLWPNEVYHFFQPDAELLKIAAVANQIKQGR